MPAADTAQPVEVMRLVFALLAVAVTAGLVGDSWVSWRQHRAVDAGALGLLTAALVWADLFILASQVTFLAYVVASLYLPASFGALPFDVASWVVSIVLTVLPLCGLAASLTTAYGRRTLRIYARAQQDTRQEQRSTS